MATLNFPSDTSQSPYEENGYTYEWDGEKWNITSSPGGGGSSDYVLPTATDVRLGGIKVGNNLTVDGSGVLSADVQDGTVGTLQQVTDAGNTTTNDIRINANAATVPLRLTRETDVANSGVLHIRSNIGGDDIIHSVFYADGQLDIGGDISGNAPNITLAAAGYSSFAKTVKVRGDGSGSLISADSNVTQYYYTDGGVSVARVDKDGTHKIGGVPDSAPNITLNADGSAFFNGDLRVPANSIFAGGNPVDGANDGTRLINTGNLTVSRANSSSPAIAVHTTGTTAPNISLNADGSAEFAGTVQTTDAFVSTGQNPQNYVFQGIKDSTKTSWIFNDGSATFAQSLTVASYDTPIGAFIRSGGAGPDKGCLYLVNNSSESPNNLLIFGRSDGDSTDNKFQIANDGSASFAGDVETDAGIRAQYGVFNNVAGAGSVTLILQAADASWVRARGDKRFLIGGANTGPADSLIDLNGNDGSASFAGDVDSSLNGFDLTSTASVGCRLGPGGHIIAKRNTKASDAKVFSGLGGTLASDETSTIFSDGSARFAGDVQVLDISAGNGASIYKSGQLYVRNDDGNKEAFTIYSGGLASNNKSIFMRGDGSAEFAGDVSMANWSSKPSNDYTITTEDVIGLQVFSPTKTSGSDYLTRWAVGNNTEMAAIYADGSAEFKGSIVSSLAGGDYSGVTGGGVAGAGLNRFGQVSITTATNTGAETTAAYRHYNGTTLDFVVGNKGSVQIGGTISGDNIGTSSPNIALNADGSASFAGGLTEITSGGGIIAGIIEIQGDRFGSTSAISVRPTDESSTPTVTIGAAGNAEFADSVKIGGYNPGSNGVKGFFYSEDEGLVVQGRVSADPLVTCLGGNSTDIVVQLSADGSASFAGNIQAAGLTDGTTTKTMTEVLAGGAGGASALYYGSYDHNNDTVTGSGGFTATENGTGFLRVTFDSAFANADDYILLYSVPACPDHIINMKSNNLFQIQMKDGAGAARTYSVDFAILPTDSSAFSIVAQNHVQTNERNNQISQALTSLKTAAAASTSHDELKAAIASALANF